MWGQRDAVPIMVEGLRRLEYRGYDSAGVAVAHVDGLGIYKAQGNVGALARTIPAGAHGAAGIGHTRWATHGEPSLANAHPQVDASGRIALVHNGIIENSVLLRAELKQEGIAFSSETDTEVLVHLIAKVDTVDLCAAVRTALARVEGTYGVAVLDVGQPDRIVVARSGSPVVIGVGRGEHFVASDVAALVPFTTEVVYLDDGDLAVIEAGGYRIDGSGRCGTRRPVHRLVQDDDTGGRGRFEHYMGKEIHEQPAAIARVLAGRLDHRGATASLEGLGLTPAELAAVERVKIVGCGSAYYAGLAGAGLIERLARVPGSAEPASEFRYRRPVIEPGTLYVAVSQSGETLDTLRAVQEIADRDGRVVSVVNVAGSSIDRACGAGIHLRAGPEVSVTSTKTFTSTVVGLGLLALALARAKGLGRDEGSRLLDGLERLPSLAEEILAAEREVAEIAERLAPVAGAYYVGRVAGFPVALEGAQKMKEVSYVHAEAYPCSELKHGPLALVSPTMPTVAVVPDDHLFAKNVSTLEEIRSRRGPIVAVGHSAELKAAADDVIRVPPSEPELDPVLLSIPLQLLAYRAAVSLGVDVDRPRNLAKSVTVE